MSSDPVLRFTPILAVTDMGRAIAFYERLGFSAVRYHCGDGYAFVRRWGQEIHLSQSGMGTEGQNTGAGVYLYLRETTAASLEAAFREAGVSILSPLQLREWKMLEFVLADPDGNLLRFGEAAQG